MQLTLWSFLKEVNTNDVVEQDAEKAVEASFLFLNLAGPPLTGFTMSRMNCNIGRNVIVS